MTERGAAVHPEPVEGSPTVSRPPRAYAILGWEEQPRAKAWTTYQTRSQSSLQAGFMIPAKSPGRGCRPGLGGPAALSRSGERRGVPSLCGISFGGWHGVCTCGANRGVAHFNARLYCEWRFCLRHVVK